MKDAILVMGAAGQIGSELVTFLLSVYGNRVVASDVRPLPQMDLPTEVHDCTDGNRTAEIIKKYGVKTIYNLPSLLSFTAEQTPQKAFEVNLMGLHNTLEAARQFGCAVFTPSTIGVFSEETPKDKTPQNTVMRPKTMYGVTKLSGELLCDYYYYKYGLDTRGVRYPGLISYKTEPGGGTTDFAVEIFIEALKNNSYTSYISKGSFLDMMYMPDALHAAVTLMEANPEKLSIRNAFNVTAMSLDPESLAQSIRKYLPDFRLSYQIDPVRQHIADSWPHSMDDSEAAKQWGWKPNFTLDSMTQDMIAKLREAASSSTN